MSTLNDFQKEILAGIPDELPEVKPYDTTINHAPKRKDILAMAEEEAGHGWCSTRERHSRLQISGSRRQTALC